MGTQNYTLGRGELFFAPFKPGTRIPTGERYFGNTPEFNINVNATNLDHFSSDHGIRERDDSVTTEINRTASIITDSIRPENVALFFFGRSDVLSVAPATALLTSITKAKRGLHYQLGTSAANPTGVRNVANVVVKSGAGGAITHVLNSDYLLDTDRGRIEILESGSIADDTDVDVTYDVAAHNRTRIISGNAAIEGALRYLAQNPKGEKFDYFLPFVTIRPNGDFSLKSDEWQRLPLSVEVSKILGMEAVYVDGQPYIS